MPTHRKPQLPTNAELKILNQLWKLGTATVDQIVDSFPAKSRPNYKTTYAFLRIMEQKNFVRHTAEGRVFVFEPLVKKEEIDKRSVQVLLKQHFGGSAGSLLVNLLESDSVPAAELDAIESMIRNYKKQRRHALIKD